MKSYDAPPYESETLQSFNLPNFGIIQCKLNDDFVKYLWEIIDIAKQNGVPNPYEGGNENLKGLPVSLKLNDKDNYFLKILPDYVTKYKDSFEAFDKFISAFPNSEKIVEAKYGLGYSQYALKNYRAAINTYSKIVELHAQDPIVPEAKYGIANCHIQLADIVRAKQTLRDLIQNYPNAEIIPSAKSRLDALNAIKL